MHWVISQAISAVNSETPQITSILGHVVDLEPSPILCALAWFLFFSFAV